MCRTNDENTVCGRPLDYIAKVPDSRISFRPACSAAMMRHIIRHGLLSRKECAWKAWDKLEKAMYLVRRDGSPWSERFSRTVHPLVLNALRRRWGELVKAGAFDMDQQRWKRWSRGILSRDWDGVTIEEGYMLLLLRGIRDGRDAGENGHDASDDDATTIVAAPPVGIGIGIGIGISISSNPNTSTAAQHGTTAVTAALYHGNGDGNGNRTETDIIGPMDSVTSVGLGRPRSRFVGHRPLNIEEEIREQAARLIELKLFVARKTYGPAEPNDGADEIEMRTRQAGLARAHMRNLAADLALMEGEADEYWAGMIDQELERAGIAMARGVRKLPGDDPWRPGFLWAFFLDGEDQV